MLPLQCKRGLNNSRSKASLA